APLDAGATLELIQRVLPGDGGSADGRELADLVYQRTRGNPFFVEETLKALAEAAASHARDASADDLRALELPRTIRDAVLGRLASLSPGARRLAGKAVHYLRAAGMHAMAKHANREAADYLTAALELLERTAPGDEETVIEIAQELARARQRLGEYDGALALWERAAQDAVQRG